MTCSSILIFDLLQWSVVFYSKRVMKGPPVQGDSNFYNSLSWGDIWFYCTKSCLPKITLSKSTGLFSYWTFKGSPLWIWRVEMYMPCTHSMNFKRRLIFLGTKQTEKQIKIKWMQPDHKRSISLSSFSDRVR